VFSSLSGNFVKGTPAGVDKKTWREDPSRQAPWGLGLGNVLGRFPQSEKVVNVMFVRAIMPQ